MGNPIGSTYEEALADAGDRAHILDHDHFYTLIRDSNKTLVGAIVYHRTPDGQACGGLVRWVPPLGANRPVWELQSLDPLTLSPSVECPGNHGCGGNHGYIRDGRWQPA